MSDKKLTKEQLEGMIREVSKTSIEEAIQKALDPIVEERTEWMKQLKAVQVAAHGGGVRKDKLGIGAARYMRAYAFGRGDREKAAWFADKAWNDPMGEAVSKALQAGDFTAAGSLVPPEFAAEIIELLRSATIVRRAGARVLPMNNGTLTINKQTGAATASYVGESRDITASEPTTGQIVLTAKKLAALVPISNDLLLYTAGDTADEFVRDDLVQVISLREDLAFLRDDGNQDKPKGIRNWAVAANLQAQTGTSAAQIEGDLKTLLNNLEQVDVRMINPAWFMAPRSRNALRVLRDASSGELVYPEVTGNNPTIYGHPVFVSTQVPTNLGAGTNESEVYLVDMADCIIGESSTLEIAVDSSASYLDSGTLVSAFSRDETLMRAIARHDFAVRHEESIAILTGVTWT
jgi:HK97 family phage major capsid protein